MKHINLLEQIQLIAWENHLMEPKDGKLMVTIWVEQTGSTPEGWPEYEWCYSITNTKEN